MPRNPRSKIIIDVEDGIAETAAVWLVLSVMRKGRVSFTGNGTPHFCWLSESPDGVTVQTRRKDHANAADSFIVRRKVPNAP